jgi:adenosine kinase
LTGLDWGLSPQRCAEVGSLLATYVIETIGTQEYILDKSEFVSRLEQAYGSECAQDVASHLGK